MKKQGAKPHRLYELNGDLVTMDQLVAISGIPRGTLYARIHRYNYPVERAISSKKRHLKTRGKLYAFAGQENTLVAWSGVCGIQIETLAGRIKAGWSIEQALITPTPTQRRRGVVSNFASASGTGGGSVAQERAEIEFSANPEKTSP